MSLNPQPMRTDLASALDSVEPARGDKHLSFEVIKKHIEDERPPIAFYSCSPIGLTYLHVYSARTISAMSQSGFKIVVNILDSPMFEHEAFLHLAKKWSSKSQETLVGKIVSDFRDLIKIVGGKLEN